LVSGAAEGRLLVHNLRTQKTKTLLSGLSYANGVAVAEDGSFVLVAETDSSRILRLWL
jgi:sugar lactone lactonase YvrE